MAKIVVEYTEEDLKKLVLKDIRDKMPGISFEPRDVHIETKSKQNYKSEWESANFRGRISVDK